MAGCMPSDKSPPFDLANYLVTEGPGRRMMQVKPKGTFFRQGDLANSVFFLQKGRAQLNVLSPSGKEAVITMLRPGSFVGEEAIGPLAKYRLAAATAITPCLALRLEVEEMRRVLEREGTFANLFIGFLLARNMRTQADLVDQLFNSSEKRLARVLLLMAEFGRVDQERILIAPVTQEVLAEMIGATRSRVSTFMNHFRRLGYIEYSEHNERIRVNRSLLNFALHNQFSSENAKSTPLPSIPTTDVPKHPHDD